MLSEDETYIICASLVWATLWWSEAIGWGILSGETIMDYSIYDAVKAGFGKVVFVIRKDFEQDFLEKVASKYERPRSQ